jgi:CRISPR-associated protein Cmr6
MQMETTAAIRPVNKAVNNAIGDLPNGPFNFGLYFQKWLHVVDGFQNDGWKKRGAAWACTIGDETELVGGRGKQDFCEPNRCLDNQQVSIALFNKETYYERDFPKEAGKGYKAFPRKMNLGVAWDRDVMQKALDERHEKFEQCAASYQKMGYRYIRLETKLLAPLVIGLGNEHPTEKGFRFDWTTGIPAIPAASIKGVVRLAYLVNELNKRDVAEAEAFWENTLKGKLSDDASSLFGCGEGNDQDANRGKVIFLDAFPKELPRLKAEIMNCHYKDYFNNDPHDDKFRGPTEDQQPNPQKFWAVDAWVDPDRTKPLHFVFRVLAARDIVENEAWFNGLNKAIGSALREHGLGAKTAIGHGRFDGGSVSAEPITGLDGLESVAGHGPQKADPEAVRRDILESFSKDLATLQNDKLPGQIGTYLQKIRVQEDDELKHSMCQALLEKGRQLGKKKKFSNAFSKGKQWAIDLKALCDECGVET